ncbi:FecR family protein [Tellurirhabdus rosea]|uniref:FecR family protein n=1 Tax=Tellurirhabdus rosea TaxID=2674997 RepID=UPI0022518D10|nr:FecR domain-containing protein [Tellurirhabdus rosea]
MAEQPENRMNDDLLGKFLAGETDSQESAAVRRGLSENETDRAEYERFSRIWEAASSVKSAPQPPAPVDTDAAWLKLKGKMAALPEAARPATEAAPAETVVRPMPASRPAPGWRTYWRVAAAVVLLLGIGWTVWQRAQPEGPPPQLAVSSRQETVERVLPDGSRVVLNRNSRLSYPTMFADSSREVVLSGEAFFDVKPDPARPFRIRAKGATVQVLGTSFGVRAYDENVRVTVKTGKVQFAVRQQRIVLAKNEQAAYDASKDTIRKAPRLDPNALAYQTGKITFDNERLADVIRTLSETYRVEIRLGNPALADCRLNSSFEYRDSAEYVLNVTAESLGLRLRRDGESFVLEGESCQ